MPSRQIAVAPVGADEDAPPLLDELPPPDDELLPPDETLAGRAAARF